MYQLTKNLYNTLPKIFRENAVVENVKKYVLTFRKHDDIYTKDYYLNDVEGPAQRSAPIIAQSIISNFNPKSVIDVGCGTGVLLKNLKDRGCQTFGLEYSEAGVAICRERELEVKQFNLENDNPDAQWYHDVAVSVEVAEHLPKRCADRYVDILANLAPIIVFTAAIPGQDGDDHVNLQPNEYWIQKFVERGFNYNETLTKNLRKAWKESGVTGFYHQNLMIFQRKTD